LNTAVEKESAASDSQGVGPLVHKLAKVESISRAVLALQARICSPMLREAFSTSFNVEAVLVGLAGSTSTAMWRAAGTSSRMSSQPLRPELSGKEAERSEAARFHYATVPS